MDFSDTKSSIIVIIKEHIFWSIPSQIEMKYSMVIIICQFTYKCLSVMAFPLSEWIYISGKVYYPYNCNFYKDAIIYIYCHYTDIKLTTEHSIIFVIPECIL